MVTGLGNCPCVCEGGMRAGWVIGALLNLPVQGLNQHLYRLANCKQSVIINLCGGPLCLLFSVFLKLNDYSWRVRVLMMYLEASPLGGT